MKSRKPKIAVITVNYNNAKDTINCIRSFAKIDTDKVDLSFFVVDNGSAEVASRVIHKKLPNAQIIQSSKNLGFAAGNNLAIRQALQGRVDYVLLINNDAEVVDSDFFKVMLKAKGDIVSPIITYRHEGVESYDYGGVVDNLFGRNYHFSSTDKFSKTSKPDYFSGACLLINAKVFDHIGLFDEKYFLYYEDADLCLRATKAGYKLAQANTRVLHQLSVSTNKLGKGKLKILANSHLIFCTKHLPKTSFPLYTIYNLYLRSKLFFP